MLSQLATERLQAASSQFSNFTAYAGSRGNLFGCCTSINHNHGTNRESMFAMFCMAVQLTVFGKNPTQTPVGDVRPDGRIGNGLPQQQNWYRHQVMYRWSNRRTSISSWSSISANEMLSFRCHGAFSGSGLLLVVC